MGNGSWGRMNDATLDLINQMKADLKTIEEKNKKLKVSKNHSHARIKELNRQLDVEKELIRLADIQLDKNTEEYFRISDNLKKLLK